jgi:hypothetical protein
MKTASMKKEKKKKKKKKEANSTFCWKFELPKILSSNLRRKASLTVATSSLPILLREGKMGGWPDRLILVSPKGFWANQSLADQDPGKLMKRMVSDETRIFSRTYGFSGDLWAFMAQEQALMISWSSFIPMMSASLLPLAIVFELFLSQLICRFWN